jgi:Subtilase family
VPEALRLALRLPNPPPQGPLPPSSYVVYAPIWLPLLFLEVDAGHLGELEGMFGADAIRPMEGLEFELCRGIDTCLGESEELLKPAPNGLQGRGGPSRQWDRPGYPVMTPSGRVDADPSLELATPKCHFVALNLSKQDEPGEFDPGAPMAVATSTAAQQLVVVVAAGNQGMNRELQDTRSPWARAPWVLAVGATEDEGGMLPAPYSGRSADGTEPELYAWHESGRNPKYVGTSFAAPRVTRELLVLAAWLHALRDAISSAFGESSKGIPLVGEATIDTGRPGWPENQLPLPAYPVVGVDQAAVANVVEVLGPAAARLRLVPEPSRLQEALTRSGRPVPGREPARFVSRSTTRAYLARFDGIELLRLGSDEPAPDDERLARTLARSDELDAAIEIWDRGSLHLYYEHESRVTTYN